MMQQLNEVLETLEVACEGEGELLAFTEVQLAGILDTVKSLPDDQREEVQNRLDRISTIIEGQMMLYGEEIERLGGQIRNVALNNAATHAYRTVAVIPIRETR